MPINGEYLGPGELPEVIPVFPLPGALPLFAGSLGAMGLLGWRRRRKNG